MSQTLLWFPSEVCQPPLYNSLIYYIYFPLWCFLFIRCSIFRLVFYLICDYPAEKGCLTLRCLWALALVKHDCICHVVNKEREQTLIHEWKTELDAQNVHYLPWSNETPKELELDQRTH